MIGGLRIIALDSSVPGHGHGELSGGQLDWLARELATPAPDGTILAPHHPPLQDVLVPTTSMRGVTGACFTRVDMFPDTAIATSVPVGAEDIVYEVTVEQMRAALRG
ncbi:hypothetical protein [Amycolatopsis acididurans]|uniref:hypothetical protein n=1 Tax=Amycolatopsis acididurans TaxID=2724524 RepID=UPI001FE706DB|nr:hypothetical protein [Amycolatopsis acididurans]